MEDLFRFTLVRPPTQVDGGHVVMLEEGSRLAMRLRAHLGVENPAAAIVNEARQFAAGGMRRSVDDLRLGAGLRAIAAKLDAAGEADGEGVAATVREATGEEPDAFAGRPEFRDDVIDAGDALIALKLLPEEQAKTSAVSLTRAVRLMRLIARVARKERLGKDDVAAAMQAPLELPGDLFPLPLTALPARQPAERPRIDVDAIAKRAERVARYRAAMDEFMHVSPDALISDPPQPAEKAVEREPLARARPVVERWYVAPPALAANAGDGPADTERPGDPGAAAGAIERGDNVLIVAEEDRPRGALSIAAVRSLSDGTRAVLEELRLDVTARPLEEVVRTIDHAAVSERTAAITMLEPSSKRNVALVGRTPLRIFEPIRDGVGEPTGLIPRPLAPLHPGGLRPALPAPGPVRVPTTHGSVRPVGVGDLLIVRQELKSYQAREVAHIENVLQGEGKLREHKRMTRTEDFVLTETERTTEEERELESTDRFEMQRETQETIKEDAKLEAGLKISGQYGPIVKFEAHANGAISRSKERSTKRASEFASEVTARSASKITERIKEQRTRRIVEEVEELNKHELDNTDGTGHVVGIYQWVEKTYEAQVWNYGIRTMYEFMEPEPAAFLIHALKQLYAADTALEEPDEFTLRPEQITEDNYGLYVLKYQATGVEPPPEPYVTVSKTFRAGRDATENQGQHVDAGELVIPQGCEATYGHASHTFTLRESDAATDILLGRQTHRFSSNSGWTWGVSLHSEVESIPVGIKTYHVGSFTIAVEVKCRRTDRAMKEWRNKTHATLMEAYLKLKSDYEEKLAALKTAVGVEIQGRNPNINRQIEKDELKKVCVELMTRQHFELFDSIEQDAAMRPQVDVDEAEAEGRYVRFFEQAFEWDNLTYVFYPYFWARKSTWVERLNYDDADPLFMAFLKAGAARVVVPAREGFEAAIDHFMNTGQVWNGGELPPITSPLYVPIIEEIRERLGAPGDERPQGDPWDVTVPTSLVYLRTSAELPRWQKQNGTWVEVQPAVAGTAPSPVIGHAPGGGNGAGGGP